MKETEGKYISCWQKKESVLLAAIDEGNAKEFTEILKLRDPREQGKVIFALWILKIFLNDFTAVSFLTPHVFFGNNTYLSHYRINIRNRFGNQEIMSLLERSVLSIRDELDFCYEDQHYHKLYSYIQALKIEMAVLPVGSPSYREKETKKIFCSKILNIYRSLRKSDQKLPVFIAIIPSLVATILKELNQKVAITLEFSGEYRFEASKFEVDLLLARPFFSFSNMPLDLFKELANAYPEPSRFLDYKVIESPKVVSGLSMFGQTAGENQVIEMQEFKNQLK